MCVCPSRGSIWKHKARRGRLLESRHLCNEGISVLGSFLIDVKGGRDNIHGSGGNARCSLLQVPSAQTESSPPARSQASAWVS